MIELAERAKDGAGTGRKEAWGVAEWVNVKEPWER